MTKNTCYFRLDRVWNIHVETTENSISSILDLKFSVGVIAPRNPSKLAPLALAVFPAVKKYSYQYEHPFSNTSYAPVI